MRVSKLTIELSGGEEDWWEPLRYSLNFQTALFGSSDKLIVNLESHSTAISDPTRVVARMLLWAMPMISVFQFYFKKNSLKMNTRVVVKKKQCVQLHVILSEGLCASYTVFRPDYRQATQLHHLRWNRYLTNNTIQLINDTDVKWDNSINQLFSQDSHPSRRLIQHSTKLTAWERGEGLGLLLSLQALWNMFLRVTCSPGTKPQADGYKQKWHTLNNWKQLEASHLFM